MNLVCTSALYAGLAVACCRAAITLFFTEPYSGFLQRGSRLGIAFALLWALVLFVTDRKRKNARQGRTKPLFSARPAMGFFITLAAAAGLVCSAALGVTQRFRLSLPVAALAVLAALSLLLLVPAMQGRRARRGFEVILALFPVAWALTAFMAAFLSNNTVVPIPENMYTLLGAAAILPGLYADARRHAHLISPQNCARLEQAAALFVTATVFPTSVLRALAGPLSLRTYFVSNCSAIDLALVSCALLLWGRCWMVKDQTEAHQKEEERTHETPVPGQETLEGRAQ